MVKSGLFKHFPAAEKIAISRAKAIIKARAKVHWSIFRTTNRKNGVYTTMSKDKTSYDWNMELAGSYFDPLMKHWT